MEKAAHLFHSIVKNPCFRDGNERTAIAATEAFLLMNLPFKNELDAEFFRISFNGEMESVVVSVAESGVDKMELTKLMAAFVERFSRKAG